MPQENSESMLRRARLVLAVDEKRDKNDPFKLAPWLKQDVSERLAALEIAKPSTNSEEGKRRGAATTLKDAFVELRGLLREGFRIVQAVPRYQATDGEKIGTLTAYGWAGGKLGMLVDNSRVTNLARLAIQETPKIKPEALRYPTELLSRIVAQVALIEAQESDATSGGRQTAIQKRNEARTALEKALRRVRFYYCAATDDADTTPELAKIGFQPVRRTGQRRLPGEVVPSAEPVVAEPETTP